MAEDRVPAGGSRSGGSRSEASSLTPEELAEVRQCIGLFEGWLRPPAPDPAATPRRVDFGYRMLLTLMGRTTPDGQRIEVPIVDANRNGKTITLKLPRGIERGRRLELQAGGPARGGASRIVEVVPIGTGGRAVSEKISDDREIDSVLVLDEQDRVVAVGPRLRPSRPSTNSIPT